MKQAIFVDTREKPKAIEKLSKQIEKQGYELVRTKLYVGDYQLLTNPFLVIDRKQNLLELIGNVTQDHKRFKAELERAKDLGIHVVILCEHSKQVKTMDDLDYWHNPRLKTSPKATTGITLKKILKTMQMVYDVEFLFCDKSQTGNLIVKILEEGAKEHERKEQESVGTNQTSD